MVAYRPTSPSHRCHFICFVMEEKAYLNKADKFLHWWKFHLHLWRVKHLQTGSPLVDGSQMNWMKWIWFNHLAPWCKKSYYLLGKLSGWLSGFLLLSREENYRTKANRGLHISAVWRHSKGLDQRGATGTEKADRHISLLCFSTIEMFGLPTVHKKKVFSLSLVFVFSPQVPHNWYWHCGGAFSRTRRIQREKMIMCLTIEGLTGRQLMDQLNKVWRSDLMCSLCPWPDSRPE